MAIEKKFNEIEDFAERSVTHVPGEKYLGKKIEQYEQVHLAVAYTGNPKDYLAQARVKLARKARAKGCEYAVDGDFCQNRASKGSVIFAATGLRPIKRNTLERNVTAEVFADENISHISAGEFLQRKGDSPDNYDSIGITTDYKGKPGEEYLQGAELTLAVTAIRKGCQYVTEIDYTSHDPKKRTVSIAARGLKKRK